MSMAGAMALASALALACCAAARPADEVILVQSALERQWPLMMSRKPDQMGKFMSAVSHEAVCMGDAYFASGLEGKFAANPVQLTNEAHLCDMMTEPAQKWVNANLGKIHPGGLFSKFCKTKMPPMLIEPLAGHLRDPRYKCTTEGDRSYKNSRDYLVLSDETTLQPGGKKKLFDTGGASFTGAMSWLLSSYGARGIEFDEIHVWEPKKRGYPWYWAGVELPTRQYYEHNLTLYNGRPVSVEPDDENNIAEIIWRECKPEDFCVLKLAGDMWEKDTETAELLMSNPEKTRASLDELFFRHQVSGILEEDWHGKFSGSFDDSYKMFTKLRKLGVRAHAW